MKQQKHIASNYDLQVDIGRKIFLEYDQEQIIRKFSLRAEEDWIYLTYLNIPCRISRNNARIEEQVADAWVECRNFSSVMTIYDLLCHHRGAFPPVLSGQWCTVGSFVVTGVTDAGLFSKKTAALFDGKVPQLKNACLQMGGTLEKPMAGADVTCSISVTPFFPVLLQFWEGDEEFPPQLQLKWDRNAMDFLHFETTFYLQGDLFERLSRLL